MSKDAETKIDRIDVGHEYLEECMDALGAQQDMFGQQNPAALLSDFDLNYGVPIREGAFESTTDDDDCFIGTPLPHWEPEVWEETRVVLQNASAEKFLKIANSLCKE